MTLTVTTLPVRLMTFLLTTFMSKGSDVNDLSLTETSLSSQEKLELEAFISFNLSWVAVRKTVIRLFQLMLRSLKMQQVYIVSVAASKTGEVADRTDTSFLIVYLIGDEENKTNLFLTEVLKQKHIT